MNVSSFSFTRNYFKVILATYVISIICFLIIKYFYPFPSYIYDSIFYLDTTINNDTAGIWPIGYSYWLKAIGFISHSDKILILAQFILYYTSALFFYTTLNDLIPIKKTFLFIIYLTLFLNPVIIYLQNYVVSDSIFLSFSLIWISLLLRFNKNPGYMFFMVALIVTLITMFIRFQALLYPIILITFIVLNKVIRINKKLLFITITAISIAAYVKYNTIQTYKTFGTSTFSVFSGWQLANNALIGYLNHTSDEKQLSDMPVAFKELHQYATTYPIPQGMLELSGVYIWNYQYSPLAKYAKEKCKNRPPNISGYKWFGIRMAQMEPLYKKYAIYLIKKHPVEFFRYYMLLNTLQYMIPRGECLAEYNRGMTTVEEPAIRWFHYSDNQITKRSSGQEFVVFDYYWILFVISLITYWGIVILLLFSPKDFKIETSIGSYLKMVSIYFIFNFLFSVFASPIVLRYQLFNLLLLLCSIAILLQIITEGDSDRKKENTI